VFKWLLEVFPLPDLQIVPLHLYQQMKCCLIMTSNILIITASLTTFFEKLWTKVIPLNFVGFSCCSVCYWYAQTWTYFWINSSQTGVLGMLSYPVTFHTTFAHCTKINAQCFSTHPSVMQGLPIPFHYRHSHHS
jgi:hypothetical protein